MRVIFYTRINKPAFSIEDRIALLKNKDMRFKNEAVALHFLENISHYRLKGYWWDMQTDLTSHTFQDNALFEDVIDRYNFDGHLRLILFAAIERIETALRTKMISVVNIVWGTLVYRCTVI